MIHNGLRLAELANLRESVGVHIGNQSNTRYTRDQRRTPVAHKRKRNSRDWHNAHSHTNVFKNHKNEHRQNARTNQRPVEIGRKVGYSPSPPHDNGE